MTVSTIDLADRIAAAHGLTKTAAKAAVEDVLKGIADAAVKGEEVSLNGFGKFKVQAKPEREGRNPSTGATIKIAASKKVVFQPAKALKDAVNG
jgi:DNA-binding protein HU-beta